MRATDDEAVLVDRGAWWSWRSEESIRRPYAELGDPIELGVHEKIVVMRRIDGAWRIAVETDRAHAACAGAGLSIPAMPAALAGCRSASLDCLRRCDRLCNSCEGCNGCSVCPGECAAALGECVGADVDFAASL